jgi:uncharacterized membrane protein
MMLYKKTMGKEGDWVDKNVDLKKLAEKIQQFFYDDGFSEVKIDEDPNNSWFEIQARKTGALRTVISSRKAIHIIIKGEPNKFSISVSTGEWGKNFVVSGLFTGGIGLIGMGFNLKFTNKLWTFIKETVDSLGNSYQKPVLPTESQGNDSLQILKRRLALGEITKEEFEEMKQILE